MNSRDSPRTAGVTRSWTLFRDRRHRRTLLRGPKSLRNHGLPVHQQRQTELSQQLEQLCRQALREADPARLDLITQEIYRVVEEKRRLRAEATLEPVEP